MTLLELLVVIAIVGVLAGVILETLVSVDKGVRQGQDQLTMAWAAEETAAGVSSVLRHAVAPAALDAEPPAGAYEFTATKCAVLVIGKKSPGLECATLEQTDASKEKGACVRMESVPIQVGGAVSAHAEVGGAVSAHAEVGGAVSAHTEGGAQDARLPLLWGTGGAPERFSTTVGFKYATKIHAVGYVPEFKMQLAPGEYPQLVRIRIRVEDLRKIEKPYEIMTAVRLM